MEVLDEPEPTLQEFIEFFAPQGVGTDDATAYYDMVVAKRQEKKQMCASALHDLLKSESLTMDQSERMLAAVQAAEPKVIYAFIEEVCDLSRGLSQQKLRTKYAAVKVAASDTPEALIKAMQLKWWSRGKMWPPPTTSSWRPYPRIVAGTARGLQRRG